MLTAALEKTPEAIERLVQRREHEPTSRSTSPSSAAAWSGASLAVALQGLGVRTALIEAVPHDAAAQPSFDERTTALSNGSRRILETLGVWPEVAAEATPIAKIHVSDQGHFGFARIDARGAGLAALGSRGAESRARRGALVAPVGPRDDLDVFCPATVGAGRRPRAMRSSSM